MRRRSVLKSIAAGAASAGLGRNADAKPAAPKAIPFITATDGTSLFYRDWGTGKPVVFAAPWALNSNWWEYQMTYLAGQGLRCVAYDRRGHGRSGQPGHGYDFRHSRR